MLVCGAALVWVPQPPRILSSCRGAGRAGSCPQAPCQPAGAGRLGACPAPQGWAVGTARSPTKMPPVMGCGSASISGCPAQMNTPGSAGEGCG